MDMAVESHGNFKFQLSNASFGGFEQENKCDIRYVKRQALQQTEIDQQPQQSIEESKSDEAMEVDEEDLAFDYMMSH